MGTRAEIGIAMTFKVVIPARYDSVRLPGKPLLVLAGKPMIQHVWLRAIASGAEEVLIATDDPRIAETARQFGAETCMTRCSHRSGTDRIAEVATERGWPDSTIVVNLQGDEPLMPPANVRQVARMLEDDPDAAIGTLCAPLAEASEYRDPSTVKVVRDSAHRALYFSRAPIPAVREADVAGHESALRHLGLYAYRTAALQQLAASAPCALENLERLEQLRALWLGMPIKVELAAEPVGQGVDSPADVSPVTRQLEALYS